MDIQPGNRGQPPWQPGEPLVPLPTIAGAAVIILVVLFLILWAVL